MKIQKVYECQQCFTIHDDEWDAKHCCEPEIETYYRCGVCGELHQFEDDAESCCADKELATKRCTKTIDMFTQSDLQT